MPPVPFEASLPMQKPVISLTLAYVAGLLLGLAALHFPSAAGFLKPEEWKAIEHQNWLKIWKRMSVGI